MKRVLVKIVVVGGSQGTGRALAEAAVSAGHEVTVLSRSGNGPVGTTVVTGTATDPAVAREAVAGADAVVVTVGGAKGSPRARTQVTASVVQAMKQTGVRRLVVQTSLGAGGSARQLPVPLRQLTPLVLKQPLADHDAQEAVVRASGLDWTIVRPAGLTNKPATRRWKALRDDELGVLHGSIPRGDVAAFMLQVLETPSTIGAHIAISGN